MRIRHKQQAQGCSEPTKEAEKEKPEDSQEEEGRERKTGAVTGGKERGGRSQLG